jgi:hypothetical protein
MGQESELLENKTDDTCWNKPHSDGADDNQKEVEYDQEDGIPVEDKLIGILYFFKPEYGPKENDRHCFLHDALTQDNGVKFWVLLRRYCLLGWYGVDTGQAGR